MFGGSAACSVGPNVGESADSGAGIGAGRYVPPWKFGVSPAAMMGRRST